MTKMIIDYKAGSGKTDKAFIIDRNEWPDLWEVVRECMNETVYLIKIYVDDELVINARNQKI